MNEERYELADAGSSLPAALTETDIPGLALMNRGKVRDVYDLGERLLIVATDRISAFDFVLGSPIPEKGRVLTQVSLFWFELLQGVAANHLLSADLDEFDILPGLKRHLRGRTMVVKKAEALPVECIARGYIVGSGWKEYQKSGAVCGIPLPAGLEQAQQLPAPLFTPSTKAEDGMHDENISYERCEAIVGVETAAKLKEATLKLYTRAADYARERGIIIADTKFEFGLVDGELTLIDEVLTPDSSRFWPADLYEVGTSPVSFDKQFVRDWLEKESGWNKEAPAPALPPEVIEKTAAKYIEAYERIAGKPFPRSW